MDKIAISQRDQCPKCGKWINMTVAFTLEEWLRFAKRLSNGE